MQISDGYFQTILLGLICFSGPGLFNALTGLGAAGGDDPTIANYSNAVLNFFFFLFGFFGSALLKLFGNRVLLCGGGLSYAIYATAQYFAGLNPVFNAAAIASGALVGIGGACLWTAQGASVLNFAPAAEEAKYISTFWLIFSLGGFLGAAVMCASNWHTGNTAEASPANPLSYAFMVGGMMLGPVLSVTLLLPMDRVVTKNGAYVKVPPGKSVRQELASVVRSLLDTNVHLLTPYFIMSNIWYAYFFNGINDGFFNIRTRCFNSGLFWLVQIPGTKFGVWLLSDRIERKRKNGQLYFWFLVVFGNIMFILGTLVQMSFGGAGWLPASGRRIDVTDFASFWFPCLVFIGFGFLDSMVQTYGMWLNSCLANGDHERIAQYSGCTKAVQALGSTASWLVGALAYSLSFQLGMCWSVFLFSLPTTYCITRRLPEFGKFEDETESLALQVSYGQNY